MEATGDSYDTAGWSVRDESELLAATCPARAAELAEQAEAERLEAFRLPGITGEIAKRRDMGLCADEDYVRGLHARFEAADAQAQADAAWDAGGRGPWSTMHGCLMTGEEVRARWDRQAQLHPLAAAAKAYLALLPADQAGDVWLEQADNGIGISLTARADVRTILAVLHTRAAPGQRVRAVKVRWSTSELTEILETALGALGQSPLNLDVPGPHGPWMWSVNTRHGAQITVANDLPGARARVTEVVDPCAVRIVQEDPGSWW